jgi:hypothetical protein
MHSALVLIENDRWDHQADEQRAHNGSAKTGWSAFQSLNLHAENTVSHAVPDCSDQEHLLERKYAERCHAVVTEEGRGDEAAERPVNKKRAQPSSRPGDRTRTIPGPSKALARPVPFAA